MSDKITATDFYSRAVQSLVNRRGENFIAELLHSPPANLVENSPEIIRFFQRFGITSSDKNIDETNAIITAFFAELFAKNDRSSAQIVAVMQALAARDGVCESVPHCADCELKKHCVFFNAPPQKTRQPSLLERLAQQLDLTDRDYLAVLIGGASPKDRDYEIADQILKMCVDLRGAMCSGYNEFSNFSTVTPAAAARLAAASAVMQKLAAAKAVLRPPMRDPQDFYNFYRSFFRMKSEENFLVVLLNQKNAVLRDDHVIKGALTEFMLTPREVFAPAIRDRAAAVVFLHNHPSGDCSPSVADKTTTKRLVDAAKILGIRVLDHLIVGDGQYFSFSDHGLLA